MSPSTTAPVHSKDLPPNNENPFLSMIKSRFFATFPQPPASTDLSGQTAIITGAATGLGFQSAIHLLDLHLSHLIIAVRTVQRGQSAANELQRTYPKANIEVWPLEMESYQSVQSFAKRCDKELGRVDMAILNAGMGDLELKFSSHGHERCMQVNYWSTALLGVLLLPIMKVKAADRTPHLTIVNSDTSRQITLPSRQEAPFLSTFDDEKWWNPMDRYGETKLAGQLFFARLAEHVSSDDVVINMVEPGFTKGTDLLRNGKGIFWFLYRSLNSALAHPASVSSLVYVDGAVVRGPESHGCYIDKGEIAPYAWSAHGAEGKALSDRIWEESLEEFEKYGSREIMDSMKKR